jgi:ABC-type Fe3+-siderophore transport system permease subunit
MADFALLVGERRMGELCHQLRRSRLVRIMTAHAVGAFEGLVLMRLLQAGILDVVALHTQRGRSFGQMIVKLDFPDLSGFVGDMAGFAAHIQGSVAAAFLRNIHAGGMAGQAEVLLLIACSRL